MPNSILTQEQDGQVLFNAISSFFSMFKISDLLKKCNARKEKGVPVISIFKYKLCNVFLTAACICSRRPAYSKRHFPRTRTTGS